MGLANLAGFYAEQGSYADAEQFYWRAVAVSERSLGSDHPDVAASLAGLAALYRDQDQDGDAEPLYQRTLSILSARKTSGWPRRLRVTPRCFERLGEWLRPQRWKRRLA